MLGLFGITILEPNVVARTPFSVLTLGSNHGPPDRLEKVKSSSIKLSLLTCSLTSGEPALGRLMPTRSRL